MDFALREQALLKEMRDRPKPWEKVDMESIYAESSAQRRHELSKTVAQQKFREIGEITSFYDLKKDKTIYCPTKEDIDFRIADAVFQAEMGVMLNEIKKNSVNISCYWMFVLFVSIFTGLIWKRTYPPH